MKGENHCSSWIKLKRAREMSIKHLKTILFWLSVLLCFHFAIHDCSLTFNIISYAFYKHAHDPFEILHDPLLGRDPSVEKRWYRVRRGKWEKIDFSDKKEVFGQTTHFWTNLINSFYSFTYLELLFLI